MPSITVGAPAPRNQFTDPNSGLRFYRIADRDLPSVTTIRRMAGLPFGLHHWSINQVIEHAIADPWGYAERLNAANANPDAGAYDAEAALIRSELRGAATAERDKAATLGTAVHDAAAAGIPLADVAPELRPRLAQYEDWLAASGVEILGAEFQVWNLAVGYAGTVDLLVRQRNGTIRVVDLKTGKGVYNDHALQVTAYSRAEYAGSDGIANEPLSALLRQAAAPAILHLADDGWEFLVLQPDEQLGAWRAFRGLHAFAMWSHEHVAVESFTAAKREGKAPIAVETQMAGMAIAEFSDASKAATAAVEAYAASLATLADSAAPGPSVAGTVAVEAEWVDVTAEAVAVFGDDIASTDYCRDFAAHQHAHRQLATGWVCDACFAAGNPFGIVPAATDDKRLSSAEFKSLCKAAGVKPADLVGLARELFPAVSDMRLLDDVQRGELYEAATARQVPA